MDADASAQKEEKEHTYVKYLQLDKFLSLQNPTSWLPGKKHFHEEHIFLVVHQAYELWFKQLIVEIDSVRDIMKEKNLDSSKKYLIITRLNRIKVIMELLIEQVKVIQTISVSEFSELRQSMHAASGFDSFQFRIFENKYGVRDDLRVKLNKKKYSDAFKNKEISELVVESEKQPTLFNFVQTWLENSPELNEDHFNFPEKYRQEVDEQLLCQEKVIKGLHDPEAQKNELIGLKNKTQMFENLFNEELYEVSRKRGDRRFSHKAFLAMLMIWMYKDKQPFIQSYQILVLLKDIDQTIAKWRYHHSAMVQEMIGSVSVGTGSVQGFTGSSYSSAGGSSGYQYLRSTVSDRYKVFLDLFNLAPFLIVMPPMNCFDNN